MHVEVWGLAAIIVVIVSWLMYRYLAPKSWKEWTRAGVLQAFIIAFYAEMYGFSLTIYFLARDFGLDLAWTEGGNLWAQLFGTPIAHVVAMVLGYTIVFAGATLVADGWRRIHQARRQGRLMTDGVYGRMRHPKYTGLFLIVFGEGIVHWPTIVSVVAFPVIVIAYTMLARREERQMVEQFATSIASISGACPCSFPAAKAHICRSLNERADRNDYEWRSPAGRLRPRGLEPEAPSRRFKVGTSEQVTSAVGADHAVREIPGSPAENPTPGAAGVPNSRKIRCIFWNRLSGTVPA